MGLIKGGGFCCQGPANVERCQGVLLSPKKVTVEPSKTIEKAPDCVILNERSE
jgi:hypothetical protein